ncbi:MULTISPECIES: cytochrome P450 [unclassified Novosphingobium]|uniref:cytochrome P450 n=1 Tax=unclassified Novosphingobium TaxID=2644732 RepID=UPI00086BAAF0|nr:MULTISPECIES: cytochrome P450 [unclassified Novosphingobium]MBN9143951.1 cytochrome P450 [Novosphingobium sp.]MDR6709147.1 cytochrome P450 [Novosphingobium sp. 1748]ODU77324.1 MAG: cytochrome [Novosphingobium sp. SCN 63-17]OJX95304.1 MAG: cytochrome [Novosphingobium sp. 63-713]
MKQTRADFDPAAPEDFDSAHAEYARLRAQCPVAHATELGGFWALTKYEDVKRAASDYAAFTTTVQNVVPKVAFTGRRPPLHLDPPEHTPYRKALNPLLSRERSEALEPRARELTRAALAPLVARGGGDICIEFSSHLPVQIFGEWMRMPGEWLETLHRQGREFVLAVHLNDPDKMKETSLRLYDMARALIAIRREHPEDPALDPTTALLEARHEGQGLPDELIVGSVRQILLVGIVAPLVMVGNMAVHLCRDRALQDQLRANPDQIPAAVEEFLRLYTPYRGFARTAVQDIEIRGEKICAGEAVALLYGSANRDEEVFPDGDRFILNRPNIAEHLAFGRGPHNCPGLHLGRMELKVALEEILAATPNGFELAGEIAMSRWPEIGALSVPLRFL